MLKVLASVICFILNAKFAPQSSINSRSLQSFNPGVDPGELWAKIDGKDWYYWGKMYNGSKLVYTVYKDDGDQRTFIEKDDNGNEIGRRTESI